MTDFIEIELRPDELCRKNTDYWERIYNPQTPFAVLTLPETIEDYKYFMIPTFKNRYNHSVKLGYHSGIVTNEIRNARLDQLYAINTSKKERQGREMAESYQTYPKPMTGKGSGCPVHYTEFFGVFSPEDIWCGYINIHVVNQVANISQILGHWEYMKKTGIMLNLWMKVIEYCMEKGLKYVIYYTWTSGTTGLMFWKQSVGMEPRFIKLV